MSKLNIYSLIINELPCMYLRHKKPSKPKIKFKKIRIFNILFVEITIFLVLIFTKKLPFSTAILLILTCTSYYNEVEIVHALC